MVEYEICKFDFLIHNYKTYFHLLILIFLKHIMTEKLNINTSLTFKEYLKYMFKLRIRSVRVIWDIFWFLSFPYLLYLSYNDYLKNPLEIKAILTANIITNTLLFIYPIYIYYSYRKSYYASENILNEKIEVEFYTKNTTFKTNFSTITIENKKINGIKIFDHFITIDFYQNFIIINRKKLTNIEDKKTLERVTKIQMDNN